MEEKNLSILLKENGKAIKRIAPKYVNVNRLLSLAVQAVQKNPLLKECATSSIVDFCIKCAEAGTDRIGAGGMWAVPFRDKSGKFLLTAIPDWRLLVEKARQAGVIKYMSAEVVYKHDIFSFERGFNPNLLHKPDITKPRQDEDMIAVYVVFVLPDGTKDFVVMTRDEIEKIKARSKAKGETSPWNTDYIEMAKKTVIKRALKIFEGASVEISKVIDMDNEAVGYEDVDYEPFVEPQEKTEEPQEDKVEPENIFTQKCEDCQIEVDKTIAGYSKKRYGKILCRDCQKKQ